MVNLFTRRFNQRELFIQRDSFGRNLIVNNRMLRGRGGDGGNSCNPRLIKYAND